MLSLPPSVRVFVATQAVDGRKGADSLMAMVRDLLRQDPLLCVAVRYVAAKILGTHMTVSVALAAEGRAT